MKRKVSLFGMIGAGDVLFMDLSWNSIWVELGVIVDKLPREPGLKLLRLLRNIKDDPGSGDQPQASPFSRRSSRGWRSE